MYSTPPPPGPNDVLVLIVGALLGLIILGVIVDLSGGQPLVVN